MDLIKSYEFFKPESCPERIFIIGCGSVGSTLAENLARFGLTKITLMDFDKVESKNIANQIFREKDVGRLKTEALKDIILEINHEAEKNIRLCNEGYTGQQLTGYVFLAVDDIDLRRQIATDNKDNMLIKAMFDIRTGLTEAQHYAADWRDAKMVKDFLNSMNYSNSDVKNVATACGSTLSVCPTLRAICALAVANFTNFVKGEGIKKYIIADPFNFILDAF